MTVKELMECALVDAVEIIIRTDGTGEWLYAYKVGEDVQVGKYDYIRDRKGELFQSGKFFKPDNKIEVCRVDGRCRMLIIPKSLKHIPKEVQNLQVCHFMHSYVVCGESRRGIEIWCYPKGYTTPPRPFIPDSQDENQITLFDQIEEF